MKLNILDKEITKSYSEKTFEIDVSNEYNLGRLFSSLIMIYENKFSFIREFVQNAYDAVVEVWENEYRDEIDLDTFLMDNPIIVSLFKDNRGTYVEIKETKGVGISEDRMDNMFRFLTKSTKRDSLEQIGAKGIGKMAALAYTDEYFISTIYDNMQYEYKISWYNQQGIPKISEPVVLPVKQHNATTVTIYLINESDEILLKKSIKGFLSYFTNIYYNNIEINVLNAEKYDITSKRNAYWKNDNHKKSINDLQLFNYKTFSYREGVDLFESELFLIVDRIPYKISWDNIGHTELFLPLGIRVSSADVLLNDNRDSIRYTSSVIEHIKNKIADFKLELLSLINNGKCSYISDITKLWNHEVHFSLANFKFIVIHNLLASWDKTYMYVKTINDFSATIDFNNSISSIFLIKGKTKLFKKINTNYISLINYRNTRKYELDPATMTVYINDTDLELSKIQNLDISKNNIVVLQKINDGKLLALVKNYIHDDNIPTVITEIAKAHSELGKNLSTIFSLEIKQRIRSEKKNKIKVSKLTSDYNKCTISGIDFMEINEITDEYVVFADTDSDKARICSRFFNNYNINKNVILVAPSYYEKIKYNISYYCNNNEKFIKLNTAYILYQYMKKHDYDILVNCFGYGQLLYKMYNFKDTEIFTMLSEKNNKAVFELIANFRNNSTYITFFNKFENVISLDYVISTSIDDIKKLCKMFFQDYNELSCIDYGKNTNLVNKLVKIVLNKNCNEQNIHS